MISKSEVIDIIENNGVVFANDLVDCCQAENVLQVVNILHEMGINNQKIKIKVACKECDRELIVRPSEYKKQKYFRCDEHIQHRGRGVDSPFYNRIEVKCTNCGKQYFVIPYDYNKTNRFGDNHNFCCQQCYWEYRSKYYIQDKSSMFGTHQTEEKKAKQRELVIQMITNGELPQTMTKPHRKIFELLQANNIKVENEHPEKYHSIDIFLSEYNLMIEIMGDYWHANPLKYNIDNLTKQQAKSLKQDKSKHSYVKKYKNIEILYLWEQDIKKNIDLCWLLIQEYINKSGKLDNYHSFNYHLENESLQLNDILTVPFQDYKSQASSNIAV